MIIKFEEALSDGVGVDVGIDKVDGGDGGEENGLDLSTRRWWE